MLYDLLRHNLILPFKVKSKVYEKVLGNVPLRSWLTVKTKIGKERLCFRYSWNFRNITNKT